MQMPGFETPSRLTAVGLAGAWLRSLTDSLSDLHRVTYLRGNDESRPKPTRVQVPCRAAPSLPDGFGFCSFLAWRRWLEGGGRACRAGFGRKVFISWWPVLRAARGRDEGLRRWSLGGEFFCYQGAAQYV